MKLFDYNVAIKILHGGDGFHLYGAIKICSGRNHRPTKCKIFIVSYLALIIEVIG